MADKEVYQEALELFDYKCAICGNPNVALHHIRFGGLYGGRKTYRGNVIPLCEKHHRMVHKSKNKYMPILIEMVDKKIGAD